DGDGSIDLAVANQRDDTISVLFNHGDGTFAPALVVGMARPSDVAIADVTGDGLPDLVIAQGGSVGVVRNTGSQTFAPADPSDRAACGRLAIADLDGDGWPDVICASVALTDYGFAGGDTVSVLVHRR